MYPSVLSSIVSHIIIWLCLLLSSVCAVLVNIDRYKGEIQQTHNRLRARQNAADMKYMYWDNRLEARAGQWSERCRFEHQMQGFGENLAFMSSTDAPPEPIETIRDGIRNWYNEIELWVRRSPRQRREFCGAACHYTQMVWSRTSRLGCTVSYCPVLFDDRGQSYQNAMYFVCFYYPQGNIVGQPVFLNGPQCSMCPNGPEPCIDGLCAGRDITGRRRRSATESWLCQSPKLSCLNYKVQQNCPQTCSAKHEGNASKQEEAINENSIKA